MQGNPFARRSALTRSTACRCLPNHRPLLPPPPHQRICAGRVAAGAEAAALLLRGQDDSGTVGRRQTAAPSRRRQRRRRRQGITCEWGASSASGSPSTRAHPMATAGSPAGAAGRLSSCCLLRECKQRRGAAAVLPASASDCMMGRRDQEAGESAGLGVARACRLRQDTLARFDSATTIVREQRAATGLPIALDGGPEPDLAPACEWRSFPSLALHLIASTSTMMALNSALGPAAGSQQLVSLRAFAAQPRHNPRHGGCLRSICTTRQHCRAAAHAAAQELLLSAQSLQPPVLELPVEALPPYQEWHAHPELLLGCAAAAAAAAAAACRLPPAACCCQCRRVQPRCLHDPKHLCPRLHVLPGASRGPRHCAWRCC